tara:strand:- start:268 stop:441 length:174 start_codon:yes stop_codon:yes gene_type:complete
MKLEEWEAIARRVLLIPNASRSEVDSVLVGVTRSKDRWLIEELKKKRAKAWTAATMK